MPARAVVALLAIHGDAHRNHPIDGGTGDRSISNVSYRSMDASLGTWTLAMGCTSSTDAVAGPIRETTWSGCRQGVATKYVVVAGADQSLAGLGRPPRVGPSGCAHDCDRCNGSRLGVLEGRESFGLTIGRDRPTMIR
jgi:hypothetical protein